MSRIAFVTNIIPHYRVSFYRRLQECLAKQSASLCVFHGDTATDATRPGECGETLAGIQRTRVLNRELKMGPYTVRHQSGLFKGLRAYDPDVLVISGIVGVLSTWVALVWARCHSRPIILWECGWESQKVGSVFHAIKQRIQHLFYGLANHILVYSSSARNRLVQQGVASDKITVCFNGLDIEAASLHESDCRVRAKALRVREGLSDRTIFLYVGGLALEKRVDLLIDAFAAQPREQSVLWLVGDGPQRGELEALVAGHGLQNVRFWGRIVEDVDIYFAACDVFVLPGIGGLALNQAMFFEKPCICSEADGTEDDLVVHGETGWRFEVSSVASLDVAISDAASVIQGTPSSAFGKAARNLIEKRSNVEVMLGTFCAAIFGEVRKKAETGTSGCLPQGEGRCITSILAGGSVGALLVLLFCFFGNTHEPELYGPSVFSWLVIQWQGSSSESGHGFFIPAVSIYLLWRKRRELVVAVQEGLVDWRATPVVIIALLSYWAGIRAQQPRLGVIAFIVLVWAVPWLLYGARLAGALLVPCVYLGFAIPMAFLTSATLPLRIIATRISVFVLQGLGFGVVCNGTAILSSPPGRFALDVAEACSGLRSLVALCALIAAYAYIAHTENWRRWVLFLCAVPIAIVGNVVRVMSLVLVAILMGTEKALAVAHDYSGYVVFTVAVLLMVAIARLLERMGRKDA